MRIKHNKILLLFTIAAIMLAVFISSCKPSGPTKQEKALLEAVKRYNSQLRLAYLEADLKHLTPVATEEQLSRLFPTIQLLQAEGDYMRAEQQTFELEEVRMLEKGKGQVDTKEKWIFWWQDYKTNEITKPQAEVTYHMRYDLVVEDGIWKVDKLEDLDEKK